MGTKLNKMKYIVLFFCIIFFAALNSCSINNKIYEDGWIISYKRQVFFSCWEEQSKSVFAKDISPSINFDVIGDTFYVKQADSLGRIFNSLIKLSKILDYNGKKAVINECLAFYESKKLDSLAKQAYKDYLKAKNK